MKKGFALMISALLIFSCAISVSAAEAQYSTAGDLYEAWYNNLPDYICGVWSTDGGTTNLTFGIQNNEAGNAGKQKILELIENDSSVTFAYQVFGRNELLRIQEELDEYFTQNLGVIYTGLDEMNNCVVLGIDQKRKHNADTQHMIERITENYGEAIRVEYTEEISYTAGELENLTAWIRKSKQPSLLMPMIVVLLFMIGITFAMAIRRKMLILQTNHGTTVSATRLPSAKDVEDMVKQSYYAVPSDLKKKVMDMIDGEGE